MKKRVEILDGTEKSIYGNFYLTFYRDNTAESPQWEQLYIIDCIGRTDAQNTLKINLYSAKAKAGANFKEFLKNYSLFVTPYSKEVAQKWSKIANEWNETFKNYKGAKDHVSEIILRDLEHKMNEFVNNLINE